MLLSASAHQYSVSLSSRGVCIHLSLASGNHLAWQLIFQAHGFLITKRKDFESRLAALALETSSLLSILVHGWFFSALSCCMWCIWCQKPSHSLYSYLRINLNFLRWYQRKKQNVAFSSAGKRFDYYRCITLSLQILVYCTQVHIRKRCCFLWICMFSSTNYWKALKTSSAKLCHCAVNLYFCDIQIFLLVELSSLEVCTLSSTEKGSLWSQLHCIGSGGDCMSTEH